LCVRDGCETVTRTIKLHLNASSLINLSYTYLSIFNITTYYLATIMSSWVGPSIYRIENHNVRKAAVQLKSGDKAEKANVILQYVMQL
jgi:hypothetical protein